MHRLRAITDGVPACGCEHISCGAPAARSSSRSAFLAMPRVCTILLVQAS